MIFEKRGELAYQLELMSQLFDVHDVFHVSQLKKCLQVPEEQIPMEDLDAKEDLSYQEYPVGILETSERVTRNKRFKMCKVQWSRHTKEEATWGKGRRVEGKVSKFCNALILRRTLQGAMESPYHLNLGDEIYFKAGRFVTP
jgi:hypothetical protein